MVAVVLSTTASAQWFQGPSGGRGGSYFDHWQQSLGARNIVSVGLLIDNGSIRCILVEYKEPGASLNQQQQLRNGSCDLATDPFSSAKWTGVSLDDDEYVIGISGRYGDRIDSLRIYTNKKTSNVFGGTGGTQEFGYTAPPGQMIVAFIGRSGAALDAIGVVYAPCTPYKKPCR
ncbi:jacalin-like lectin [Burkholderia ubonensis]|uniref:jacalin-like lectin n=1 Tax=Burkholderia ubonensis TaxID=101571 RepID=UPI0022B76900|nr:jacalin-like lectin [Burkholderia ubonensis]